MEDNQHDITRRMLNIIREGQVHKELNFLKEYDDNLYSTNPSTNNGVSSASNGYETSDSESGEDSSINDQDVVKPSQEEVTEDQNSFMEMVGSKVKFTVFNIYPEAGNVVFGGKFDDGMEWQFSLEEENGLYITANNLQLSDDKVTRMQKLKGQYDNWSSNWTKKMVNEYKPKNNNNYE